MTGGYMTPEDAIACAIALHATSTGRSQEQEAER